MSQRAHEVGSGLAASTAAAARVPDVAIAPSALSTPASILALQRTAGNAAVGRMLAGRGASPEPRGSRWLMRACPVVAPPAVGVRVDALFPFHKWAEECLQELYALSHPGSKPGISLGFNLGWIVLKGKDRAERQALSCLRGNFTAKSGIAAGEPDIWDFANRTMYEITTWSGRKFRDGKLGAEIELANDLASPRDCGGVTFGRGDWHPGAHSYLLKNGLYLQAVNRNGVLVYTLTKDMSKELVASAVFTAMAAAAKKFGGGAAAKAVAKKAIPGYAIASLAAAAVLLASGKAEAKLGLEGEEPLAALAKALAAKGTPVPPEVMEMIESSPQLKARVEAALKKGGDPTKAQNQFNAEMLDIIAKNRDKFTAEDLEAIIAVSGAAGNALPKGKATVESVRKMLDAAAAGSTAAEGAKGDGTGSSGKGKAGAEAGAGKGAAGAGKGGADATTPGKQADGARKPAGGLSPKGRQRLMAARPEAIELFVALTRAAAEGAQVSDEVLDELLKLLPAQLSDEQVKALIKRIEPVAGETADEVLAALRKAIAEKPPNEEGVGVTGTSADGRPESGPVGGESAAADPTASATTEPSGAPGNPHQVQELRRFVRRTSFARVKPGTYRVRWKGEAVVDAELPGSTYKWRGRPPDKRRAAAWMTVRVKSISEDGNTATLEVIRSTPLVDADGNIVRTASEMLAKEMKGSIARPARKKVRSR